MKDKILGNLNDPRQLERLYRSNKMQFMREFLAVYPDLKGSPLADYWHERLSYQSDEINWGSDRELLMVLLAALVAGLIAKLPAILSINEEFFYPRNIGFIIFPLLTAYFALKNKLSMGKMALVAGISIAGLVFINSLPDVNKSDTTVLSCIHLLLVLWSLLGFAFVGENRNNSDARLGFLKYNGDLVVITTLIVIAGVILSGITIGLFTIIGYNIREFYFMNIVIFGLPAVPILGTYLTQTNPQLVGKVSPVIARIFSPLVLFMLTVYLIAMIFSGKDPYNDREFLLVFNALLIGVMALIFFSVAETSRSAKSNLEIWVLTLLSVMTIIVNSIALSAILFRIAEWGITPNRIAVLGSNVLILANLLWVTIRLFRVVSRKAGIYEVGKTIAYFLPVYFIWTVIVTFVFPLIFGFR